MISILNILLIVNILILPTLTNPSSAVEYFVLKMFSQLCPTDQKQTISLYECEERIKQHDKKEGNYRGDAVYEKESFYLMNVYDLNKDGRLNKREAILMGEAIYIGQVNSRAVDLYWRDHKKVGRVENIDKQNKQTRVTEDKQTIVEEETNQLLVNNHAKQQQQKQQQQLQL